MRQLEKIILDQNTTAIRILENGEEIAYEAFPSKPALKINGIQCVNDRLTKNGKEALTTEETQTLQSWMDEVVI